MKLQFLKFATLSQVHERIQELQGIIGGYEQSEAEILAFYCVAKGDALLARKQEIDNALACQENIYLIQALREERRQVERDLEIIQKWFNLK